MNKINIILITIILLVFLLYVCNCKNEVVEPFQDSRLNMLYGLNNDGNVGACGGGGAGGTGVAGSTTKSNGGLPLNNISGKAGGDAFDTSTTGGGGGGYTTAGNDNNDAGFPGKGGNGINLTIESSPKYCFGGNGGVSSSTNYVSPIVQASTNYGCGGYGASNKQNSLSSIVSYTGDNGTYGVVYMIFYNSSTQLNATSLIPSSTTLILQALGGALKVTTLSNLSNNNINININGSNPNSGCDFIYNTTSNYLKFYIPTNNTINKIDYIVTINDTFSKIVSSLNCYIHVIGGGGGGGGCFENSRTGGGGGAGQYITDTNFIFSPNATHYITIGNGGMGGIGNKNGNDGYDTTVSLNTNTTSTTVLKNYIAYGGGGGAGGGVTNNSKNEDLIKKLIRKIYVADVESIRNLSNYASKILSGGIQIDGNLRIASKVILSTVSDLGPPKTILSATNNLENGDIGTKLVLSSGTSGAANVAIHPYALGMNTNEMWFGIPFSQGNTITSTMSVPSSQTSSSFSGNSFNNIITTALTTKPTTYSITTMPNNFKWYSGSQVILTLDANSNLILSPNINYSIPTGTGTITKIPTSNTLYTVYLNIGTYNNGSLLSYSNNALNINSNLSITNLLSLNDNILDLPITNLNNHTVYTNNKSLIFNTPNINMLNNNMNINDWVVVCYKNSGGAPNNILINGIPSAVKDGGNGNFILTINNNSTIDEKSDWGFSYLLIWDSQLSDNDLKTVSECLMYYLNTGIELKSQSKFNTLITNTKIYAMYFAKDFVTNKINDSSGNNRHATTTGTTITNPTLSNGNGATSSITLITGSTTSSISFTTIQPSFTICSITRYTGSTNNKRILCSQSSNVLIGHHEGKSGVVFNNDEWKTLNANYSYYPNIVSLSLSNYKWTDNNNELMTLNSNLLKINGSLLTNGNIISAGNITSNGNIYIQDGKALMFGANGNDGKIWRHDGNVYIDSDDRINFNDGKAYFNNGDLYCNGNLVINTNKTTKNAITLYCNPNYTCNSNNNLNSVNMKVATNTCGSGSYTESDFLIIDVPDVYNGSDTIVKLVCSSGANSGYTNLSQIVLDGSYNTNSYSNQASTIKFQYNNGSGWKDNAIFNTGLFTFYGNISCNTITSRDSYIRSGDSDWLRLLGGKYGTAVYNGLSLGDGNGLNVGSWGTIGNGQINCTGNLTCGGITCTGISNSATMNVNGGCVYLNGYHNIGIGTNKYRYGDNGPTGRQSNINSNLGLYVACCILSNDYHLWVSDIRTKTNIINMNSSLQNILKLYPKTYNYIDKIRKPKTNHGFIAQDVEKHFPNAITTISDFIPNIYKLYNCLNNTIFIDDNNIFDLNINDEIKIFIKDDTEIKCKIININKNNIIVDNNIDDNKCFVYGKKVNDFKTLDYNYIYTLNVAATQELYKEHIQLKKEHMELKEKFNILLNKLELSF